MNDKENAAQPEAVSGGNSIEDIMSKVYDEAVEKETKPVEKEAIPTVEKSENSPVAKEDANQTLEKTEKVETKADAAVPEKQEAPVNDQYKQIEEAFAPIKAHMKEQGLTEAQYIKNVVNLDNLIRQRPMEGFVELADIYNIDLVKFSQAVLKRAGLDVQPVQSQNQQQKPNDDTYVDPALHPVFKKLNDLEANQKMMLQEKREAENRRVVNEINEFSSKQKYWGKVENQIVPLVASFKMQFPQNNNQEILQMAYEAAIWANPEVKAILLNEERAKQVETANAKAVAAKKAGASVTGSPSGKVSSKPLSGLSTEEIMTRLWDQAETGRIQ